MLKGKILTCHKMMWLRWKYFWNWYIFTSLVVHSLFKFSNDTKFPLTVSYVWHRTFNIFALDNHKFCNLEWSEGLTLDGETCRAVIAWVYYHGKLSFRFLKTRKLWVEKYLQVRSRQEYFGLEQKPFCKSIQSENLSQYRELFVKFSTPEAAWWGLMVKLHCISGRIPVSV